MKQFQSMKLIDLDIQGQEEIVLGPSSPLPTL